MTTKTQPGEEIIQEDLLPLAIDINSPVLDPRNAREHPEENLDQIKLSLLRYGQCKPVVVNKNSGIIEAGNGMVVAARELGWKRIAVARADHEATEAMAYGIMDNKSGLSSAWDLPNLKDNLQQIDTGGFDMRYTGFTEQELEDLMTQFYQGGETRSGHDVGTPGALMQRFIAPPFSILDARQGYWQERKRLWLDLGLKSELGRPDVQSDMVNAYKASVVASKDQKVHRNDVNDIPAWAKTSIFDPVLCELAYTWFAPVNGTVLDPFAGGSVRGIIAAYLGLRYTGIDLRPEQVKANYEQAEPILSKGQDTVTIKVSGKWARHLFRCDPEYIKGVCKGRCCEGTDKIIISLTPEEENWHKAHGCVVVNGLLQPDPKTGVCPHKTVDHLCELHGSPDKPFGCVASPFNLNDADTLIVRQRYSLFKCHNAEGARLAYETFRESFDLIFGEEESARVIAEIKAGADVIEAQITASVYRKLVYLDSLKGKKLPPSNTPNWIVGDSRELDTLLNGGEAYDFLFTCPPYYDLEVYTDDGRDLCNAANYDDFKRDFGAILEKSVARLKPNRFACLVVGDIRDKAGYYRGLVVDTIKLAEVAGLKLYNDAVLVNAVGTASLRANSYFSNNRKLVKTHQNVLVFYKGDIKAIREEFPEVVVADLGEYNDVGDEGAEGEAL